MRLLVAMMLSACTVGESGVIDACFTSGEFAACTTGAGKAGYCVPDAGCVEACTQISHVCWNYTYVWPNDPQMQGDPICWCSDDSALAPSQR